MTVVESVLERELDYDYLVAAPAPQRWRPASAPCTNTLLTTEHTGVSTPDHLLHLLGVDA